MRGRSRPAGWVGGLLALLLAVTGCTADANDPTQSGGQQGYPDVGRRLTLVPPEDREAPIPEVTGADLDGTGTLSTRTYAGKVVVINVWGSWCPPCRKEAPDLQSASVETAAAAQFLGITTKDRQTAAPQAFVKEFGVTYPSIYDPDGKTLLAFAGTLPPSAPPSTLVLDREGRLAARVLGPISKTTLVQMVNDVAAGK